MRGQKISAILEPSTYVTICACEHAVVLIMRSGGVYSVYTSRRIVGTVFLQCETACLQKKIHCPLSGSEQCHHDELQLFMRTTKTNYAAGLPAVPFSMSILFFGRQCNRILHFLRIADTCIDVDVCLDGLACKTAWSSP